MIKKNIEDFFGRGKWRFKLDFKQTNNNTNSYSF